MSSVSYNLEDVLSTRLFTTEARGQGQRCSKSSMLQSPASSCIHTRNLFEIVNKKKCGVYVGDTIFQVLRPEVKVTVA